MSESLMLFRHPNQILCDVLLIGQTPAQASIQTVCEHAAHEMRVHCGALSLVEGMESTRQMQRPKILCSRFAADPLCLTLVEPVLTTSTLCPDPRLDFQGMSCSRNPPNYIAIPEVQAHGSLSALCVCVLPYLCTFIRGYSVTVTRPL